MFRLVGFLLLLALLGISSSQPQRETIQKAEQRNPGKPIASPHCKGPAGLDSWALLYPQSDSKLSAGPDSLPLAIVIPDGVM